jgi:hypothetical protein
MAPAHPFQSALALSDFERFYREVRHTSERLGEPLSDADATVQSMPDASPAKWHLAHTTWFFEAMVLSPHLKGYRPFDERFTFLFNSYYETLGARRPRPRRGMITRPALDEVYAYRAHVDEASPPSTALSVVMSAILRPARRRRVRIAAAAVAGS